MQNRWKNLIDFANEIEQAINKIEDKAQSISDSEYQEYKDMIPGAFSIIRDYRHHKTGSITNEEEKVFQRILAARAELMRSVVAKDRKFDKANVPAPLSYIPQKDAELETPAHEEKPKTEDSKTEVKSATTTLIPQTPKAPITESKTEEKPSESPVELKKQEEKSEEKASPSTDKKEEKKATEDKTSLFDSEELEWHLKRWELHTRLFYIYTKIKDAKVKRETRSHDRWDDRDDLATLLEMYTELENEIEAKKYFVISQRDKDFIKKQYELAKANFSSYGRKLQIGIDSIFNRSLRDEINNALDKTIAKKRPQQKKLLEDNAHAIQALKAQDDDFYKLSAANYKEIIEQEYENSIEADAMIRNLALFSKKNQIIAMHSLALTSYEQRLDYPRLIKTIEATIKEHKNLNDAAITEHKDLEKKRKENQENFKKARLSILTMHTQIAILYEHTDPHTNKPDPNSPISKTYSNFAKTIEKFASLPPTEIFFTSPTIKNKANELANAILEEARECLKEAKSDVWKRYRAQHQVFELITEYKTIMNAAGFSQDNFSEHRSFKELLIIDDEVESLYAEFLQQKGSLFTPSYLRLDRDHISVTDPRWKNLDVTPRPYRREFNDVVMAEKKRAAEDKNAEPLSPREEYKSEQDTLKTATDRLSTVLESYPEHLLEICKDAIQKHIPIDEHELSRLTNQFAIGRQDISQREQLNREWEQHVQPYIVELGNHIKMLEALGGQLAYFCHEFIAYNKPDILNASLDELPFKLKGQPLGNLIEDLHLAHRQLKRHLREGDWDSLDKNQQKALLSSLVLYDKVREIFAAKNPKDRLFSVMGTLQEKIKKALKCRYELIKLHDISQGHSFDTNIPQLNPNQVELKARKIAIIHYNSVAEREQRIADVLQGFNIKAPTADTDTNTPAVALLPVQTEEIKKEEAFKETAAFTVKGNEAKSTVAVLALGNDKKPENLTYFTTGINLTPSSERAVVVKHLGKELDPSKILTTALNTLSYHAKQSSFKQFYINNELNEEKVINFFKDYKECPPTEKGLKKFLEISKIKNPKSIAKHLYLAYESSLPETIQIAKELADPLINNADDAKVLIKGPPFFKYITKCYLEAVKQLIQNPVEAKRYEWVDTSDPMGARSPKPEDVTRALSHLIKNFSLKNKNIPFKDAREQLRQQYSAEARKAELAKLEKKGADLVHNTKDIGKALEDKQKALQGQKIVTEEKAIQVLGKAISNMPYRERKGLRPDPKPDSKPQQRLLLDDDDPELQQKYLKKY